MLNKNREINERNENVTLSAVEGSKSMQIKK